MKRSTALFLLPLICLLLPGCQLIQAPLNLLQGMVGAVGRSVQNDDPPSKKPLNFQQREIEEGTKTLEGTPEAPPPTVVVQR